MFPETVHGTMAKIITLILIIVSLFSLLSPQPLEVAMLGR